MSIYSGSDVRRVCESQSLNAHGLGRGYSQITSNESWTVTAQAELKSVLLVAEGWRQTLQMSAKFALKKFLLHLTVKLIFLLTVMGRCSASNRWTEILSNSHLHRIVVSQRQWDERTTPVITQQKRKLTAPYSCFVWRGEKENCTLIKCWIKWEELGFKCSWSWWLASISQEGIRGILITL